MPQQKVREIGTYRLGQEENISDFGADSKRRLGQH